MTQALTSYQARLNLPPSWPEALNPRVLAGMDAPTPYLVTDLTTIADRYARLHRGAARRPHLLRDEVQLHSAAAAHVSCSRLRL